MLRRDQKDRFVEHYRFGLDPDVGGAWHYVRKGHWPFPRDKLTQGYAYILTHPGTPVIFYDHLYDFGFHDILTELIEARRRARIHCRSAVKIYHANNEGYVAQIGDTLVMKLGHFDWNPSKENHLEGSWQTFVMGSLEELAIYVMGSLFVLVQFPYLIC
ncbi:alpha-amylase-like 3 [Prunus dulcis]|uniref:alpha-amylase n=1 Tax=Prunus dulcis TaxID=3755 RepID=A0A4Y1RHZ1_PRUDU|nr:alpha-amylase-like 3 [Prunus dulcis]